MTRLLVEGGSPVICLFPSRSIANQLVLHNTHALNKSVGMDQNIIFHQSDIKSATKIDWKPKEILIRCNHFLPGVPIILVNCFLTQKSILIPIKLLIAIKSKVISCIQ